MFNRGKRVTDMKTAQIVAVHDDDIHRLFVSLGVKEQFDRGEITCSFCGDVINYDTFIAVFPEKNQIKFCCNKPICYMKLINEKRD